MREKGQLLRHEHHLRCEGSFVVGRRRNPVFRLFASVRRLRAAENYAVRAGLRGVAGEMEGTSL